MDGYLAPTDEYFMIEYDVPRHHPLLVQCVEELGEEANGECSELKIKEIEEDYYRINDYDGKEAVETLSTINWTKIKYD